MKIFIGTDHTGFELKRKLIPFLGAFGHEVIDKGVFEFNKDDDYPDFVKLVAKAVANDLGAWGIVIGGSGQGEAMCVNRVLGARAVVFYGPHLATQPVDVTGRQSNDSFEIVRLAREHNDANILSLAVRFVTEEEAKQAVKIFLETPFSGDARHIRRIKKIDD
ncbi:hypothetical protein A3B93_01225 [Candidatus Nomurabacteria bacterium RIFCSPHIGHO2_02_FULL_42_24]|uniref:Ribose-5-phosphate isomerase n=1 Tax=Candidatus Nomurabacteria bacterium RIFCSPHIGHO2_02_FULL_42_24 TaxID=1801757 RepID=A0A1F6WHZ8_9BACT|nr:MAG: Ribose-5-phosphate isomerase B [Parcubacteria group bacterium GW2011_GWA2_42_18]OGI81355.1 MAG: hypothetical protein A3B93_01225 [Candidatus Nomurabacteria bacterium RIFCSPHIGHO2_02_FULL_42_24]